MSNRTAPGRLARFGLLCWLVVAAACATDEPTEPVTQAPTTSTAVPAVPVDPDASTTDDPDCRETASGPTTYVYAEREGVDPAATSLDVYLPPGCGPVPVVVWVHGGGWRRGDNRGPTIPAKVALAEAVGAALVSVEYRLSTPGSDVRWPDHGDDVAAAVAWIHAEGPGIGLDPSRVALVGHSAGAHLVSIVATDPGLLAGVGLTPEAVSCVVALDSAAYDLAGSPAEESGLVANAFGTDPEVIAAASPLVQVRREGAPAAPFLVVTRGSDARRASAQEFADAVVSAGGQAELVVVNPYDHGEVNTELGVEGETLVTPPTEDFLGDCLTP